MLLVVKYYSQDNVKIMLRTDLKSIDIVTTVGYLKIAFQNNATRHGGFQFSDWSDLDAARRNRNYDFRCVAIKEANELIHSLRIKMNPSLWPFAKIKNCLGSAAV